MDSYEELKISREKFVDTIDTTIQILDSLECSLNLLSNDLKKLVDYNDRMNKIYKQQILKEDRKSIGGGDI